jgi:uncharacterized protein
VLAPVAPREREPILDALRGFAILGILLVNIEVMRGPQWLFLVSGGSVERAHAADRVVGFAIGWLGTGKFLSSLAILFGVGAALIARRSLDAGERPHALLWRRYAWLTLLGIAHMLLYPGDILFLYGLTGFALLPFTTLRTSTVLLCSVALFAGFGWLTAGALFATPSNAAGASVDLLDTGARAIAERSIDAFSTGSWSDIFAAQVAQAWLLQLLQLTAFPWVLALFLFGYAVARMGIVTDPASHRTVLARGAAIGLGVGLPLNFGLGFDGPLSGWGTAPPGQPAWMTFWGELGQLFGEPVLAVGYLCAIALVCLRRGAPRPLVAVGRMALTAYVLQSALALAIFGGLRLYGQLTTSASVLVVAVIWSAVFGFCAVWLRWFRLGPVEWLWRSLTYGTLQPMRIRTG